MNELRDLRASYDEETRHLIREVENIGFLNRRVEFEDLARYRAIATTMLTERFRFDEGIRRIVRPHLGPLVFNGIQEPVDLRQFFTRAAIEASHEVRA